MPRELRGAHASATVDITVAATPEDKLRATEIAIEALQTIQKLTCIGPDRTQDALLTIRAIVVTVCEGLDGKTSPEVVAAELAALVSDFDLNMDAVHNKFDAGGEA